MRKNHKKVRLIVFFNVNTDPAIRSLRICCEEENIERRVEEARWKIKKHIDYRTSVTLASIVRL